MSRHKVATAKMLWGDNPASWEFYNVPSQPAWVLLDATGNTIIKADFGEIPFADVLKLAVASSKTPVAPTATKALGETPAKAPAKKTTTKKTPVKKAKKK